MIDGKKNELFGSLSTELEGKKLGGLCLASLALQELNLGASANLTDDMVSRGKASTYSTHQYVPILQQKTKPAQPLFQTNKTATNTNCHLIPSLELSFYSYTRILILEGTFETRGERFEWSFDFEFENKSVAKCRVLKKDCCNRTEYNEFQ